MRIICGLNSISWTLLLWVTLCKLTNAQVYYEDESCDFGTYRGICLAASKCAELPAIMEELGLKNTDVGHCGFTAMEEIICCPSRPKPEKAPKELPNTFIDLLKPFEFRPPSDNETTPSSTAIPSSAIDDWFSNNFKQTVRNPKSGIFTENSSSNGVPINDDNNTQRINAIFGKATQTINPTDVSVSSQSNLSDNKDERIAAIFGVGGDIFNGNSAQNGMPIGENNIGKQGPTENYIQKINAIFNVKPTLNGNADNENTQKINSIFNRNPAPNIISIEKNTQAKGDFDEDNLKKINSIFSVNSAVDGNSNDQNTQQINNIFNQNPAPNGIPIEENILGKEDTNGENMQKIDSIFNANPAFNGNPNNENSQKINPVFNPNGIPIEQNTLGQGEVIEDNTKKINSIFSINPAFNGNFNNENTPKNNPVFNPNLAPNGIPIEQNTPGKGDFDEDNIKKINSIFSINSAFNGNFNNENTPKINPVFNPNSATSGIPIDENTSVRGNANEDNIQKINTIFNNNPTFNGNSNYQNTPKINGNRNDDTTLQNINAQFNGNSLPRRVPNAQNTFETGGIFNGNPSQNGIPIEQNTRGTTVIQNGNRRFNTQIFGSSYPSQQFPIGNILSSNNHDYIQNGGNILTENAIFNGNPFLQNTRNSMPNSQRADPFQNFLKRPRTNERNSFRMNDNVINMPVQQPPLPLPNQQHQIPTPTRRFGFIYGLQK